MIVKGIIVKPTNKLTRDYDSQNVTFNVRLPIFESYKGEDQLIMKATVSADKGFIPNYQEGDIVFVSFENNSLSKPIILGSLYQKDSEKSSAGLQLNQLEITNSVTLPAEGTLIKYLDNQNKEKTISLLDLIYKIDTLEQQVKNLIKYVDDHTDNQSS